MGCSILVKWLSKVAYLFFCWQEKKVCVYMLFLKVKSYLNKHSSSVTAQMIIAVSKSNLSSRGESW